MAKSLLTRCDFINRVLLSLAFLFLLVALPWSWATPPAEGHVHPKKGPYGGLLLEVGEEEYHIEVLLNERTNILTVYLLDATGKAALPTEAKEVLINVFRGGKSEQFVLPAVRFTTDPAGMASQFQLQDKALIDDLHRKDNVAHLVLTIKGQSYVSRFDLKHEHDRSE